MLKIIKKIFFKKELQELESLKKEISDVIEKVGEQKQLLHITSIGFNLACQEISQRTHDSRELVSERILDMAIENYYYKNKPVRSQNEPK